MPACLLAIASEDLERQARALEELWQVVAHQGTVYDCTPHVVPFLAALVADPSLRDRTRAELALLLAAVAGPAPFVTGELPRLHRTATQRTSSDPIPERELDEECRRAVVRAGSTLESSLLTGPPATRAALVAVSATMSQELTAAAADDIAVLVGADDPRLAHAAQLTLALREQEALTTTQLTDHAAVDDDAPDHLLELAGDPLNDQAVELVLALCEGVVASLRSQPDTSQRS